MPEMSVETRNCSRCAVPLTGTLEGNVCSACLFEAVFLDEAATEFIDTPVAQLVGDYELLEEIGRGGMGVVYKARQRGLDRIVAVKMLLHGEFADAKARQKLLREAKTAARLAHANIVAIH